jgi:pilus assembly protein CpaE
VHRSGLHLLAAPNDAALASELDDAMMTQVLTLARRAYDFVIVDTFPLVDRTVMAVLDLCDRTYVVLENTVPTILGASKYIELLDGLGIDRQRQRIVINRALHGSGNPSSTDVARRLGRDVSHTLPYSRNVIAAANLGEPFILRGRKWWGFGRALRALLNEIDALGTDAMLPSSHESTNGKTETSDADEARS